jgi:hypothetical protein
MRQPLAIPLLLTRRGWASIYWGLGLTCLLLAAFSPWLLKDFWPALILIGLPLLFSGALALLSGLAMAQTRLEITEQGLVMRIPAWRGCPCPPARTWRLAWREIKGLSRRKVLFRVFLMTGPVPMLSGLAVVVYTLETDQGRITLPGSILPRLPQVLDLLASRCSLQITEGEQVQGSLIKTMLTGRLPNF